MTHVKNLLAAYSLFLFSACTDGTTTTGQAAADPGFPDTTNISDSVMITPSNKKGDFTIEQYITAALPGWHIPPSSSWEKYWYDRYKKGKNLVFRVQSDFDGNGGKDYAFILKDSADNHAVWAFLKNDSTYTKHRVYNIARLPNSKLHVGLGLLKAGSYNDLNTTGPDPVKVKTGNPAIHVIFFETAAKAYYWKDNAFHLIQTGD